MLPSLRKSAARSTLLIAVSTFHFPPLLLSFNGIFSGKTMKKSPIPKTTFVDAALIFIIVASLCLGYPKPVSAAIASGYSEYYIPGFSDDLMAALDIIETDSVGTQLTNIITISVGNDNVTVYYDHWENGYGFNSATLTGADETYTANRGNVLTFKSTTIPYPRGTSLTACSGSTFPAGGSGGNALNCYDGRDRIYVAGGSVAVAQAFWSTSLGTNFANAWEIYPIKPYNTSYVIPVGEDLFTSYNTTNPSFKDFLNVIVMVQATADSTNVQIDSPKTAGVEVNTTLNKGQTTRLDHIWAGTTVNSSNPVQVQFLIGEDLVTPSQWNSRSYTAVPSGLWASSYYSPVPGHATYRTDLFIYNPTASALSINYQDTTGSGTISVPANSTRSYQQLVGRYVPANSAVYLAAADGSTKFWAIGGVDTGDPGYNWGFTLLPASTLTKEYFVSWAPGGWVAASGTASTSSYSPIFVTPAQDNTTIYVDYSPTDGLVDRTFTLNRIAMSKIFDSAATGHTADADNSGTHVWATGPIALVWGQDDSVAPLAAPGLDAGYTILPLNSEWIDVILTTKKTANPTTISTASQVVTFTLLADTNHDMSQIDMVDNLPSGWTYVNNSSVFTLGDGSTISGASANPTISGQKLTWTNIGSSISKPGLAANQQVKVVFNATAPGTLTAGSVINEAITTGTISGGTQKFTSSDTATLTTLGPVDLQVTKTNTVGGSLAMGGSYVWNINIQNIGTSQAASFSSGQTILTDNLPNSGATYALGTVTTSGGVTGPLSCTLTAVSPFNLSCTANSGTVAIPAGAAIQIPVTVTPTATGYLTNPRGGGTCAVDPGGVIAEGNEFNNSCADSVVVSASPPDLKITKTNAISNAGQVGIAFTWTLTVSNTGAGPAAFASGDKILTDTLPANASYGTPTVGSATDVSNSGSISCTVASGTLTCTANGTPVTLGATTGSFKVNIPTTPTATGSLANTATVDPDGKVTESDETNNSGANTVNVMGASSPDLAVTKTNNAASNTLNLGGSFTWTLTVSNTGSADATFNSGQTILSDPLPANATYGTPAVGTKTNISGTGSISCAITTGTLACTASGGTVIFGASTGSFPVTLSTTPTSTTSLANTATVDPNNNVTEGDETNNTGSNTVTVNAPDLKITKTNTISNTAVLGKTFTWTLTVSNTGSADATFTTGQTILSDPLPANATYGTPAVGTTTGISGAGTINCAITSGTLACTASGGSVTIGATTGSFPVTLNATPNTTTSLVNTATVDPNNNIAESDETNDTRSNTVTVTAPDLKVTKTNTISDTALLSSAFTWTLTVSNTGSADATFASGQTILRDPLPANATYGTPSVGTTTSITNPGNISCSIDLSKVLTCTANGGSVTVGATTGSIPVTLSTTPTANGSLANTATVDPNNNVAESDETNDTGSNTVTVTAPDLKVAKTDNATSSTLALGGSFTWTLTVSNTGNADATFTTGQTLLSDPLPSGPTYGTPAVGTTTGISGTGTISCAITSGTLACTASAGTVIIGATSGSFPVTVSVTPTATGSLANTATVDPNNNITESNETNDIGSDTVTVNAPDLKVTKTNTISNTSILGSPFTWTITVSNTGSSDATFSSGQTILRDPLPANATYGTPAVGSTTNVTGAANISCSVTSNVLTCVASGGSVIVGATTGSFPVTLSATPSTTTSLANTATVDPNNNVAESDETNNTGSNTVAVNAPDLTVAKSNAVGDKSSVAFTFSPGP
jgi:uncharacterized repeat protein (TIGR01451 family)